MASGIHQVKKKFFSESMHVFICNIRKIFTFGEIIFLTERCIVKKKTYLCLVRPEKWPDVLESVFLLYPDTEIANFQLKDRDNSNAHSVSMYIMC